MPALEAAVIADGAVFRAINRHGRIAACREAAWRSAATIRGYILSVAYFRIASEAQLACR